MIYIILCLLMWMNYVNCVIDMNQYKLLLLEMHNDCRREVTASNMQKLEWSSSLEEEASVWADNCNFEHQRKGHGENLAMYTAHLGMEELLRKGFKMWHKEQEKYTYGQDFTMETGHYTQLIWANTNEVGCGMTRCPVLHMNNGVTVPDSWFLVCFYNPAGNIIRKNPYIDGNSCKKCKDGQQCDNGLCQGTSKVLPAIEHIINGNTCEDGAIWCDVWSELCHDVRYRAKMYMYCRKTCELCNYQFCVDKRATQSCEYWKHFGYCTVPEYGTFMHQNCARTCNYCQNYG